MRHSIPPPHEASLFRASELLPEIPLEVGEGFFAPLIKSYGWPFTSAENSLDGTEWHRILYPFSLRQFSQLRWGRKAFFLDKNELHPVSKNDIDLVIRNQTEDVWASIGRDSEPCRRSTAWHKAHILSAGRFCAPVTLALTSCGLRIFDGTHRIAALLDLGLDQSIVVIAWVGHQKHGA